MSKTSVSAGIQALLTGTGQFVQVYNGEPKDFANQSPVATVHLVPPLKSVRYTAGGKVHDESTWQVRCYVDYDSQATAEATILGIIDALLPLFQTRVQLAGVAGVVLSDVEDSAPGYAQIRGITYRLFELVLHVTEEYTVAMTS